MQDMTNPSKTKVGPNWLLQSALAAVVAFAVALVGGGGFASADDPPADGTATEAPKVRIASYSPFFQKVGDDWVIKVAKVRCVVGTCQVNEVTKARAYVRGKKFPLSAELTYPTEPIEAGQTGEVTAVLPAAAVERLGGPRRVGRVWLRIKATATLGEQSKVQARAVSRGFRLGKVPKESRPAGAGKPIR